jgi:excisionase family DNA binding protein
MEYLTVQQAAEILRVTSRRVQAMIAAGQLPATRFGRAFAIRRADLALVAERRPGRPAKAAATVKAATKRARK